MLDGGEGAVCLQEEEGEGEEEEECDCVITWVEKKGKKLGLICWNRAGAKVHRSSFISGSDTAHTHARRPLTLKNEPARHAPLSGPAHSAAGAGAQNAAAAPRTVLCSKTNPEPSSSSPPLPAVTTIHGARHAHGDVHGCCGIRDVLGFYADRAAHIGAGMAR